MISSTFIFGVILSFTTTLSNGASSFQLLAPYIQRTKTSMSVETFTDDLSDRPGLTLGFIGCGTIASAIVTGFLTQNEIPISAVYVSRRSQSKSSALAQKYGDRIIICDDNQKIVDSCGTLFVCVLPEKEEEIISGLTIGNDKTLISLVSTSKVKDLIDRSGLPVEQVYKMICLPAVAKLEGTPLLVPPNTSDLHRLISTLGGGTCINCKDESIMEAMMVTTCMMGPIYGLMKRNRDYLVGQGVPAGDASFVVGRQYYGMVKDALTDCENPDRFDNLVEEQTPGGLNEQTLRNLDGEGFLDTYEKAMGAVLSRIQGKTDGSIPTQND
mmetsp:Transcript_6190/g.7211  ORF Transcript_6190/g.7211 Transcript_6190/m.7211 type:complete len:327 (+) Transcript_6190:89-1069(+)